MTPVRIAALLGQRGFAIAATTVLALPYWTSGAGLIGGLLLGASLGWTRESRT